MSAQDELLRLYVQKTESIMSINYTIAQNKKQNTRIDPEELENLKLQQVMTAPFGEDIPIQCHHVHHGIDQQCSENGVVAVYIENPMEQDKSWYVVCQEHASPPIEKMLQLLGEGEKIDVSDL